VGENNFITIPPGGVAYMGPRGKYYGLSFSTAESSNSNLVEAGKHKITVTFASRQDGKTLGFNDVWNGDVVSNVVEIDVK
jgi:hypothetical protein